MEENEKRFLAKENTHLEQKLEALETCSKEKDKLIYSLIDRFSKQKQVDTVKQNSWQTAVSRNHPPPEPKRERVSSANRLFYGSW